MTSKPDRPEPVTSPLTAQQLAQAEALYRDLTMRTFAFEIRIGHHLAFVRTFASPSVVGLLAHTGHIEANPHRRGTDTGLFMYELIHHGLESAEGLRIVERLNDMHHRWRISNDDYLWVLGSFCVLGIQMIDRYGWRPATEPERQATIDWYRDLGSRMGITGIPATYADFAHWFADYEKSHLKRTPKGLQLVAVTRDIVFRPVPRLLRRPAINAASVIVDEPARSALGLPSPSRVSTAFVRLAFRARATRRRRQPTPAYWFQPGQPSSDHPDGYTIETLGPSQPRAPRDQQIPPGE